MAVMLDIIGAIVLVGMLIATITTINSTITLESANSASEYYIQSQMKQLAWLFEWDLYKIGYNVTKPALLLAEVDRIRFKADLWNAGSSDVLEYKLGDLATVSQNPRDRELRRIENSSNIYINLSVTGFRLSYYNARDSLLTAPVTGSMLDSVRAVRIYLTLESPDPLQSLDPVDTTYTGAYYEKLIYPRNLQ
ncbi:MAG TPA: hypothetical protein VFF29_06340 [Bacteroidota bacterium]|nr:hypothetical protein [Bacteroidota bacterium]